MRKLIAEVFMNSLDGLLADNGTDCRDYCFSLPHDTGWSGCTTGGQVDLAANSISN